MHQQVSGEVWWEGLCGGKGSVVGRALWWEGLCSGRGCVVGGVVWWEGLCGGRGCVVVQLCGGRGCVVGGAVWWKGLCVGRGGVTGETTIKHDLYFVFQIALERLPSHQKNCPAFVELAQSVICSLPGLESALASSSPSQRQPMLYSFDHVYPSQHGTASDSAPPVAILYGRLGSEEIEEFHNALKLLAGDGKIKYAFRHFRLVSVRGGERRGGEGRCGKNILHIFYSITGKFDGIIVLIICFTVECHCSTTFEWVWGSIGYQKHRVQSHG